MKRYATACMMAALLAAGSTLAQDDYEDGYSLVEWGGCELPGRYSNWKFSAGTVLSFEGLTQQVNPGVNDPGTFAGNDFELDDPSWMFGFTYEHSWMFVTFQWDFGVMNPAKETTASRDYFLKAGDSIDFNGQSYDYMRIAAGTPLSTEVLGLNTELNWLITPFGLNFDDYIRITPSLDAGMMMFAGQYTIDAGDPTGAAVYQTPSAEFVTGGETSGMLGVFTPQFGFGGEFRLGGYNALAWTTQIHYMFSLFGGTILGGGDSDEFEHSNLKVRTQLEIPRGEDAENGCFTLGVQLQMVETTGLTNGDPLSTGYRYSLDSVLGTIGFTF